MGGRERERYVEQRFLRSCLKYQCGSSQHLRSEMETGQTMYR